MKIEYRKGDVWLCEYGLDMHQLEILEVVDGYVRHKFGWESAKEWHDMAKTKIGRSRRFMGIRFGINRNT